MNNIFSGLYVGLKSLETQRKSLDVTGHNIANANNEDYSRQRAVHKASYPYTSPGLSNHGGAGQFGTGVELETVERVKDQFIAGQIFKENQTSSLWAEVSQGLEKIEYIFNEPSESSLATAFNGFWNSLQDLSNNPNDTAARNMVRERAYTMMDAFKSIDSQLVDYKASLNENLSTNVDRINLLSDKIADLNKQIVSVKGSGQNPNDLLDQRDSLFKELNQFINVQSREDKQGNLIVSTGGMQLVNGSDSYHLETRESEKESEKYKDRIFHVRTDTEIEPTNGKLAGTIAVRDEKIDLYREKLDTLAVTFVNEFNTRHKEGYDKNGDPGADFFEPIETDPDDRKQSAAALMKLAPGIEAEDGLEKIAAGSYSEEPSVLKVDKVNNNAEGDFQIEISENGSDYQIKIFNKGETEAITDTNVAEDTEIGFDIETGTFITDLTNADIDFTLTAQDTGNVNIGMENNAGSGDNANFLADIFDKSDVVEGTSVDGYYRTVITSIGAESQRASEMQDNEEVLLKQLNNLERSVSGVSLDEEMTNLIKYQQAYNASAKYITKVEEIIDSLMSIVR